MSTVFRGDDNDGPEDEEAPHGVAVATRPYGTTVPDTLQQFLSAVGVVASPNMEDDENENTGDHHNKDMESIFESYFDLTEERLRFVFGLFDTDQDGRISYDMLQQGFKFHNDQAANLLDQKSFEYLVHHLDLDESGDITFDEFKEGLRLLMLRSLFQARSPPITDNGTEPIVEVMDYDSIRFVKQRVVSADQTARIGPSDDQQQLLREEDFYFRSRPDWVQTRWINIVSNDSTDQAASLAMNRIAIKYLLHPLALEDALSPDSHRPKAELYTDHYFIMAPVFFIEWEARKKIVTEATSPSFRDRIRSIFCVVFKCTGWIVAGCPQRKDFEHPDSTSNDEKTRGKQQVHKIRSQMASIFVSVPQNDTIITFTSSNRKFSQTDGANTSPPVLWQRAQRELEKSYSKLRQYDAQYLTYALLDEAVDIVDPILITMRKEIDRERRVLRSTKFRDLARIRHLKGQLEKMGRKFKPFLRLLTHVIEDDAISQGATVYLRDVLDNLECSDEELGQLISECDALYSEADKVQSRQMDVTLYTLTVLSAVFLPAQFLTGLWGMNFTSMPELDEPWGYRMFWGVSLSLMFLLVLALNFGRVR